MGNQAKQHQNEMKACVSRDDHGTIIAETAGRGGRPQTLSDRFDSKPQNLQKMQGSSSSPCQHFTPQDLWYVQQRWFLPCPQCLPQWWKEMWAQLKLIRRLREQGTVIFCIFSRSDKKKPWVFTMHTKGATGTKRRLCGLRAARLLQLWRETCGLHLNAFIQSYGIVRSPFGALKTNFFWDQTTWKCL